MRKLTSIFALVILLPFLAPAQTQTKYKIVILGSSTAYGVGASVPDSSWVGRTNAYYKSLDELDTIINLAVPGSYSDSGVKLLPTAMSYNPDIVFVAFPSNDIIAGLGVPLLMSNLRKMYNTVTAAGKKCYVTTTQPRDDPNGEALLRVGKDSVLMEFPGYSLDFYDPLVAPTSNDFNPLYTAEGTHPNNAGHQLLFQVIQAANIITPIPPLAITLTGFSGLRTDQGVRLSWAASSTDGNTDFYVERSGDGTSYQDLYHVKAISDGTIEQYSFTDPSPLSTHSFYRLKTLSDGNTSFSKIIPFDAETVSLAIKEIYMARGRQAITTRISIPNGQTIRIAIFTTSGTAVKQLSYAAKALFTTLDIPLPTLSSGLYILQITTSDGQRIVRSFPVLR